MKANNYQICRIKRLTRIEMEKKVKRKKWTYKTDSQFCYSLTLTPHSLLFFSLLLSCVALEYLMSHIHFVERWESEKTKNKDLIHFWKCICWRMHMHLYAHVEMLYINMCANTRTHEPYAQTHDYVLTHAHTHTHVCIIVCIFDLFIFMFILIQ